MREADAVALSLDHRDVTTLVALELQLAIHLATATLVGSKTATALAGAHTGGELVHLAAGVARLLEAVSLAVTAVVNDRLPLGVGSAAEAVAAIARVVQ